MPRSGRRRKKTRTAKEVEISEHELRKTPRCFVLKRGHVGDRVKDLVQDFREVMMPNTAKKLRESKMNRMEDFIAVAGQLHVSHLVVFTATKAATYMKLAKLPTGPTLTFKVESFSLARDVRASLRRPRSGGRDYTTAPLQVLNGFGGGKGAESQLTAEMLRGLFPAVDVPTFNQAEVRRTALFHHDGESGKIQFRHFSVGRREVGLQRGISKLLRTTRLPKMGRREDIADWVLDGGAGASESEVDEAAELPDDVTGGRTAVRLSETGPRMELLLIKAEEEVCGGGVLYHRYQTKTPSQQEVLAEKARQRRKLRERNERLSKANADNKTRRREKEQMKKARQAEAAGKDAEDELDGDYEEEGGSARAQKKRKHAGEDETEMATGKRKRFHPFGWGAKATKRAASGDKGGTVEMNDKSTGKGAGKNRGGKGKDRGGKGSGAQRALERFRARQGR